MFTAALRPARRGTGPTPAWTEPAWSKAVRSVLQVLAREAREDGGFRAVWRTIVPLG